MAPDSLLLTEILRTRRKIRRTRQRATSHRRRTETLENLCTELLRTNDLHGPQELDLLHHFQTTDPKTGTMVGTAGRIQIQDCVYTG